MKAIFKETNEVIEVEPIFDRYLGEFICYQSGDFTKGNVKSYSKYELDFDTEKKNFDPSKFVREGQVIMEETIDWEQRRYEIAKEVLAGLFANSDTSFRNTFESFGADKYISVVQIADRLIEKIKNK